MEKQETIKQTIREVRNLVIKFVMPFGLKDPILATPKEVKKMQYKLGFMEFFSTAIGLVFAFLLKVTNIAIEAKLIFLGISFFMLYKGQEKHVVDVKEVKLLCQKIKDHLKLQKSYLKKIITNYSIF